MGLRSGRKAGAAAARRGGDTMARAGVGLRCWRRSKADQPDAESPQRRGESSRQGRRAARQRAGGERRGSERRGRTGRPRRSFFPSKGRCPPLSWLVSSWLFKSLIASVFVANAWRGDSLIVSVFVASAWRVPGHHCG